MGKIKEREEKYKKAPLFFAIIVTTLILIIGLSIAQIITTELKIGSDISKSQTAYYAAEKGLEAALLKFKEVPNLQVQFTIQTPPPLLMSIVMRLLM